MPSLYSSNMNEAVYGVNFDRIIEQAPKQVHSYLNAELARMLELATPNYVVLEVGCGSGRVLAPLSQYCRYVVGIDNQAVQISASAEKISRKENVEVVLADASIMPFNDSIFDLSLIPYNLLAGLRYQTNVVLEEMVRVTKQNGIIAGSVYSEDALEAQLEHYENLGFNDAIVSSDYICAANAEGETIFVERFTPDKLRALLTGFDFRRLKVEELDPISYFFFAVKSSP